MYSRGGKTFSKEAMHSSYNYFIENHSNRYPEVLRWTLFAGSEFCKIFFPSDLFYIYNCALSYTTI